VGIRVDYTDHLSPPVLAVQKKAHLLVAFPYLMLEKMQ
jgi:hypothetical protein